MVVIIRNMPYELRTKPKAKAQLKLLNSIEFKKIRRY